MLFTAVGCFALAINGQVACYSGTTIYCSDQNIGLQVPTCTEWDKQVQTEMERQKMSGCMSQDGSSSSCAWNGPHIPSH